MKIEPIIQFLGEIEKFKTCERTCRTTNLERAESDAEHSWHLAVFLILLENEFKGVDFTKVLKLSLIHDLPELYTGDANPYRDDNTGKEEAEKQAAKKLFSLLPGPEAQELTMLFDEYASQRSPEAKIVKAADKLMPLIQNLCTTQNYSSYRKLGVEYKEVLDYMGQFFSGGVLEEFYNVLLAKAKSKGVFAESDQ